MQLRAGSLVAHAAVRCFATSARARALPALTEVKTWDAARVVEFAKSAGLDDDDAAILSANKVNGKDLVNLTEDKLLRANMPLGPATRLATAIAELRDVRE